MENRSPVGLVSIGWTVSGFAAAVGESGVPVFCSILAACNVFASALGGCTVFGVPLRPLNQDHSPSASNIAASPLDRIVTVRGSRPIFRRDGGCAGL